MEIRVGVYVIAFISIVHLNALLLLSLYMALILIDVDLATPRHRGCSPR
jgi:hypothetical protein